MRKLMVMAGECGVAGATRHDMYGAHPGRTLGAPRRLVRAAQ